MGWWYCWINQFGVECGSVVKVRSIELLSLFSWNVQSDTNHSHQLHVWILSHSLTAVKPKVTAFVHYVHSPMYLGSRSDKLNYWNHLLGAHSITLITVSWINCIPDGSMVNASISGTWNVLSMSWTSFVRILVRSKLECIVHLSKLY